MATPNPVEEMVKRSVETPPDPSYASPNSGSGAGLPFISWMAGIADGFPDWGTRVQQRDMALRAFLPQEPFAASAIASVCARNAAFGWTLDGPESVTSRFQQVLLNANWGRGWVDFIVTLSMDLLTQDKGAFVELIREQDRPDSPVIGLKTLDAGSCWTTGVPETPVIFYDRAKGKYHVLSWYHVVHLREMPMPAPMSIGGRGQIQMSALTRVLKAIQIRRNIYTYKDEKTSGRFIRAVHVLSGVGDEKIAAAIQQHQAIADGRQLTRYSAPVIVTTLDPETPPQLVTLELATMPDGYDAKADLNEYITCLALGLLVDYQDLAPLATGNMGTASQSEILDKKSKAKGAGIFRKIIAAFINMWVLPDSCEFNFDEQDLDEDFKVATNKKLRAEGRAQQVVSGEVDALGARQIALDEGDISQELFDAMGQRDVTEQKIRDDERAKAMADMQGQVPGEPKPVVPKVTGGGAVNAPPQADDAQPAAAAKSILEGDDPERLESEDSATDAIATALGRYQRTLARVLAQVE